MYCPVCGAEYRPGFTECSDCQVALVAEPPRASSDEAAAEYSSYVTIWSGDDPLKHAEILETLDEAGIPTRSLNREDRSFHLVTMPAFEVFVPEEFADSAQEALKQIAAIENPDDPGSGIFEIPAEDDVLDENDYGQNSSHAASNPAAALSSSARLPRASRGAASTQYDEQEDANVEVWSGEDAATANMIALSLRENEIPFRRDPLDSPQLALSDAKGAASTADGEAAATNIFVYPEDERRAREIIREILNAAPPG